MVKNNICRQESREIISVIINYDELIKIVICIYTQYKWTWQLLIFAYGEKGVISVNDLL